MNFNTASDVPSPTTSNLVAPRVESAAKTYTRAAVWMIMPTAAWLFCTMILFSKVKLEWELLGSPGRHVAPIFALIEFPRDHGRLIFAAGIGVLALLEAFVSGWPKRRRVVVAVFTWLYSAVMFVLLAAIATLSVLIVSLLKEQL